jgi:predicted AAA+ superfamily ATPase
MYNVLLVHGQAILPQRALIVFDEILECNEALNTLKYFCENAAEYAVASTGSLLGVAMSRGNSFPVGKVDFLQLNPICFSEFRRLSLLDPIAVKEDHRLFTEFKDALSENYVLQHLIANFEGIPRYWTSGNQAEVDFLIQVKNEVIPIEVKSDENIRSKSLTVYHNLYQPTVRIRYSLKNLKKDDGLINIPLFILRNYWDLLDIA